MIIWKIIKGIFSLIKWGIGLLVLGGLALILIYLFDRELYNQIMPYLEQFKYILDFAKQLFDKATNWIKAGVS